MRSWGRNGVYYRQFELYPLIPWHSFHCKLGVYNYLSLSILPWIPATLPTGTPRSQGKSHGEAWNLPHPDPIRSLGWAYGWQPASAMCRPSWKWMLHFPFDSPRKCCMQQRWSKPPESLVFKICYRLVSEIKYACHFSPLNLGSGF